MTNVDKRRLHPDDHALWLKVAMATRILAHASGVPGKLAVHPVHKRNVTCIAGYYFYRPEHQIQLSLCREWFKHEGVEYWGDRYNLHNLLDTICHEVAHAFVGREEHYGGHGPRFFRAFARAIETMEDLKLRVDIAASGVKLKP